MPSRGNSFARTNDASLHLNGDVNQEQISFSFPFLYNDVLTESNLALPILAPSHLVILSKAQRWPEHLNFYLSIRFQYKLLPTFMAARGSVGASPSCHWVKAGCHRGRVLTFSPHKAKQDKFPYQKKKQWCYCAQPVWRCRLTATHAHTNNLPVTRFMRLCHIKAH